GAGADLPGRPRRPGAWPERSSRKRGQGSCDGRTVLAPSLGGGRATLNAPPFLGGVPAAGRSHGGRRRFPLVLGDCLVRAARIEPAAPGWRPGALPISQTRELAEGAGVEPARPEGLGALARRCLAARPTLRNGV